MEEKFRKWQILYIDNIKYTVVNMIEYKENSWIWQEYEIHGENQDKKWLCVEKDEYGKTEYSIYKKYSGKIDTNELYFFIDSTSYELYEKGIATVKDYFGNADVDLYETCDYIDYISKNQKQIISVERWEDETEKSQGEYIDSSRVRVTNEQDIEKIRKEKAELKKAKISVFVTCTFFLLCIVIPLFSSLQSTLASNKAIEEYLEKQTKKKIPSYSYVTSITNNTNNKKAKVYKSALPTIDSVVKNIIDAVPEKITNTIDSDPNTQEDGIGLNTKKEFAYIYMENGIVYVQVSKKDYVTNSGGTTYHSSHNHYYYSTFGSTRSSPLYSNYSYSARQSSINSRIPSGGGTSSGK